jgi:hypothetical protein
VIVPNHIAEGATVSAVRACQVVQRIEQLAAGTHVKDWRRHTNSGKCKAHTIQIVKQQRCSCAFGTWRRLTLS